MYEIVENEKLWKVQCMIHPGIESKKKCQVKKLFIVPLLIYQKAEYVKWKCMNMKKKPAVNET